MEDDATIQHERAVKFDFHTDADDARAHGAEEGQVTPAAVDGVQVVRHRVAVEEVLRAAGGGACALLSVARGISEGSVRARGLSRRAVRSRDARAAAVLDAGKHSSSGSGLMLMIDARGWP